MNKPSAIKRELSVFIVLNNLKQDKNNRTTKTITTKPKKIEIEMVNLSRTQPNTTLQRGGSKRINEIKKDLENNHNTSFLIKNRKDTNDIDIFEKVLDYMKKTNFCNLNSNYIKTSIYKSDFIIFINNGLNDSIYEPMCIAFINVYNDKHHKILYISTFCSNRKLGQCGEFLMNTIKYIATLLNCKFIYLNSINDTNTLNFYEKNKFINIENGPVKYDHFYLIEPEDKKYKQPPAIQGNISLPLLPWYHFFIDSKDTQNTKQTKNSKPTNGRTSKQTRKQRHSFN